MPDHQPLLTAADLAAARARIAPYAHRTPVLTSQTLDAKTGGRLFFKCENLQKVGAFKFRGACNAIFSLSAEELARGVATHSSGNHAQATALAAKLRGTKATIVMPRTATRVKREAVIGYGAEVVACDEPTPESRQRTCDRVIAETGATFIHPYNDLRVIAGQGTAALELFEDVPDLDLIVTPVGGGGLLAGTALAAHYHAPNTTVVGAEPSGADDAYRSLAAGRLLPSVSPHSLGDGLLGSLGEHTFAIIQRHVARIVLVDEDALVAAMRLVWERMKIIIEPSSAVAVAAVLGDDLDTNGKRVGVILSGGNVDLERLPWMRKSE